MAAKKKKPVEVEPVEPIEPAASAPSPRSAKKFSHPKLVVGKVEKFFPLAKMRDLQHEAIEKMVASYNNGAQYVALAAPTGTGKSALGVTMARAMGDNSHMLTLTEQLQDQYTKDFAQHGLTALKGRGKFRCHQLSQDQTCNDGKHIYSGKNACKSCPYKIAREAAMAAPHTVSNFHSFWFNVGVHGGLGENADGMSALDAADVEATRQKAREDGVLRPLIVVDEAHALEGFLMGEMGLEMKPSKFSFELPALPDEKYAPEPYFEWLKNYFLPAASRELEIIKDPRSKEDLTRAAQKVHLLLASAGRGEEWIPERQENHGVLDTRSFALKPLVVNAYGKGIHGFGERQLFMSATILSAWQFVTSIGLDPEAGDYIELDCPFPKENRPINVVPLDQSYKARDETWPHVAATVGRLLTHHKDEKGLLLCPSNVMLDFIKKKLPRDLQARIIIAHGEDRMKAYHQHKVSKFPTVLAASGFWEGADLAGDASRFQIIPACPRPMWQGQIKARAGKDPGWYRWQTWTKMIQGMGRSVRSETDTAVSYVLDKEFVAEMNRTDSMIPRWMKDAVTVVTE